MAATEDLIESYKALCEARVGYQAADAYYEGDVGVIYASQQVRRLLHRDGVEDVNDFNYARIPVDAIASRLRVTSITAVAADDDMDGQDDAQASEVKQANKILLSIGKRNQLDIELKMLMRKVSRYGDAYMLVWPVLGDPEAEQPLDEDPEQLLEIAEQGDQVLVDQTEQTDEELLADAPITRLSGNVVDVDMLVNLPHNMRMFYDEENPLLKSHVIKSWETVVDGKNVVRANMYYDGYIQRWVTQIDKSPSDVDSWILIEQIEHPFGLPIHHFRNDRPYGCPEHKNAYGPQQMINKLIIGHAATVDYQSFPQRFYLVDPKIDDPMGNLSDPLHPEDEEDDPEDEGGGSGLRADPGVVWRLHASNTGQYQAADPNIFLDPLTRYIKAMAELTDTPQHAFTKASADMPSGEAVRELNRSHDDKIEDRQEVYGATLQDAEETALEFMGITGVTVDVKWRPVVMVNDSAGWGVVQQKIGAGVPVKVALTETGYPEDQVEDWVMDMEGADLVRQVELLAKLGEAVQTLGAGVTLGVISDKQVQQLFDRILQGTSKASGPAIKATSFRDPPPNDPAAAAAKAAQEFPAPPPQIAVDPTTGKPPPPPPTLAAPGRRGSPNPNGRQ